MKCPKCGEEIKELTKRGGFMMSEEQFDQMCDRALVRVAKLCWEHQRISSVIEKLVERNDTMGMFMLGLLVGIVHGLNDTSFAHAVAYDFAAVMKKLDEGVQEEEILRELERARKEARLKDFMAYGG
jgi:hypothetical protein